MKQFEFQLDVTAESYLAYYRGEVKDVVVRCQGGQTIRFPATLLQAFVAPSGIHGRFILTCEDNNKGAKLRRL